MPTSNIRVYKHGKQYLAQCGRMLFVNYRDFVVVLDPVFLRGEYFNVDIYSPSKNETRPNFSVLKKTPLNAKQKKVVVEAVSRYGLHLANGFGSSAINRKELDDRALVMSVVLTNPKSSYAKFFKANPELKPELKPLGG